MFSGKGSISSRERSFFRRLVNRNVAGFFRPFHRSSGTYLGKQQKDVKYTYICVCVCVWVCVHMNRCVSYWLNQMSYPHSVSVIITISPSTAQFVEYKPVWHSRSTVMKVTQGHFITRVSLATCTRKEQLYNFFARLRCSPSLVMENDLGVTS